MTNNTIRTVVTLIVLGLIVWGGSYFMKTREVAVDPCATDIHAVIMPDLEKKLKTEKEISQAMFDHYFSYYMNRPGCPAANLKAAKLVSVGTVKRDDPEHFVANIVFNLQPVDLAKTEWVSPESSTTTDGWINNKKGSLSIRVASSTYYLVL